MPSWPDWIERLFVAQNRQMAWGRIGPGRVIGSGGGGGNSGGGSGGAQSAFVANDDYVQVRLGSMFLRHNRELWLKLSPLLHARVGLRGQRGPRDASAVIGPAQFGDLAAASAERSVLLNQRLAGPAVWRGGDLDIAAGLFAVPRDQAAAALLDTLGQLAGLGIPGLQQGLDIARIVRSGVEGLIGLSGTRPVLAVKVSLTDTADAGPCQLAGLAAPDGAVDFGSLWVRDGRLFRGASALQLSAVEEVDHILLAVERGLPRQDWRGLPGLTPHEAALAEALSAGGSEAEIRERLRSAFGAFDTSLAAEEELTRPDQRRIREEVRVDLLERLRLRLDPLAPRPETRSIAGVDALHPPSAIFNFSDVGDLPLHAPAPLAPGELPF